MLTIQNHSDTALFVLHEIYGINRHMEHVCKTLSNHGFDVFCPNLLNRDQPFDYCEEEAAYQHFVHQVGFEAAARKVRSVIDSSRSRYRRVFIIGYSVGATIAWLLSGETLLCSGVVCYYGSRIRDYLEIQPITPVLLFLPQQEKSFDVGQLLAKLRDKENVTPHQLPGLHGCSDPFSPHYNQDAYRQSFEKMLLFLN
ncbi:dienelactone hydrolase family protein [Brevibacillus humidisoli]|uniref:dienelactone hydrolase family protein n=1 Tax=Brevibacillus humidisoli TaxID=2895522 RepID=UPI001E3067AD|nr:dienelactone hydrolase family protein [Brevibacillus humidisoli]UFJ42512.1 dienelactone hydrolase family protein [Brevibacillus humidisoli]